MMSAICPTSPNVVTSIGRKGGNWRLVLSNRWDHFHADTRRHRNLDRTAAARCLYSERHKGKT
jgi:hypothetical protein